MSETKSEKPIHANPEAQWSYAPTALEMRESSSPFQRALLSVLAVAHQYDLNPAPLLTGLAEEQSSTNRYLTYQFVATIAEGADPIDALVDFPTLLVPESVLALQLARGDGTLSALYEAITERLPENAIVDFHLGENQPAKIVRLILRFLVFILILNFLMMTVIPEFVSLGIDVPQPLLLLISILDLLLPFWFLGVLFMMALFPFCFSAFRNFLKTWSPTAWRSRSFSPSVNRRRSLAVVVQTGRSVSDSLASIAGMQPLDRLFKRLGNARARIKNGQNEWNSLADERIISHREAEALALSSSGDTQAWLLRWSASNRSNQESTRASVVIRLICGAVHLLLALLTALVCISIFAMLIALMSASSKPL